MADVEVQNGKAREGEIAMESRAESEEDLMPSKYDSDASYVFVSGADSPTGPTDPHSNGNGTPVPDIDADAEEPPSDVPSVKQEEDSTVTSRDPQPDANGVHHCELHPTTGSLVGDASAESNAVEDGTLEVAAEQSPADSFDALTVHVVDDEGKAEVEPHPSIEVLDPQISGAEDAQPDPSHGEGEQLPPLQDDVSSGDPQTEPGIESSHDPDVPPPSLEKDLKLAAADDTDPPASQEAAASALDSDLHAGISNHLVDSNGDTSEKSLSRDVGSLSSSDSKTIESCSVAPENEPPEHSAYETPMADGNVTEVINVVIDSVQESVQLPDVSQEALPDPPQATPGESQLPIVVDTLPSAVNHEDAHVSSQENGTAGHVRALEPDTPDEDPIIAEEVEETASGMDAGDSSAKESHLPEDTEVQTELVHRDVVVCGPTNGMTIGTIPLTFSSEDVSRGDVAECDGRFNVDNPEGHTGADDSTDGHSGETDPSNEVVAGSIVQTSLTSSVEDVHSEDVHVSEPEVLDKSMNSGEKTLADPDIHSGGDQTAKVDGVDKTCEENGTNGILVDETSTSSLEGSTSNAPDGQNASTVAVRRPFYYMVKVPRYYEDQSLRDQITDAELQVAEKTKSRDAIQAQRQVSREKWREYADIIKAAKAARGSLSAKRREMDSVNLVIDKVKVAAQVDEIDAQIRNMDRNMQHETLPLKEEKQLIREIKQLKQDREQLYNKMASQVEVQQAFDQKDQAEESLKLLKKEADLLRENLIKAEAAAKVAERKLDEEHKRLEELDACYKSANATRQEAYAHQQSLRKQFYDKRRFFSQFKCESERAKALALSKDWQGLEDHCDNQLERVMELWNNDDEFRKDYMRCNLRSTIWRLGTLDGRSLGPGEEPPLIPTVNERVAKLNTVTSEPPAEVGKSVPRVGAETGGEKPMAKIGDKKNLMSKSKDTVGPTVEDSPSVSGGVKIIEQAGEEEEHNNKLTKEEEEMAKMAEELRKKEEAARLKEQRKVEEKAKAIEAMERKKRSAERAQARAALKAQKEAEVKEKEREKKARKKEKKKAATEDWNPAVVVVGDSSSSSTEAASSEPTDNPVAVSKRAQKFTKQSKTKSSIPPPLRNRGRRRMQTWIWALVAVVVALFVLTFFSLGSWSNGFGV